MNLVYDKDKIEETSKFTGQPVEKLCKDLGFHYTYLQEQILKITTVQEGWELWYNHNGDKKSDCIIGKTITKLLIAVLKKTTDISVAHQLHTACPDANNWRDLINIKINELCLIEFNKRKDKMSIENAKWLLGRCPEVGNSSQIITDWINDRIEMKIPHILTIEEGINLWNICDKRIAKPKKGEKVRLSKGVINSRRIECQLGSKYFKKEIMKMYNKSQILDDYNSLPEKHFEKLKISYMERIYELA